MWNLALLFVALIRRTYTPSNYSFLFMTGPNENPSRFCLAPTTFSLPLFYRGYPFFLSLTGTPPFFSWHANVRLWALCPITLTCDRWSLRAETKGKIYRRKRRDFLRDWGQERYTRDIISLWLLLSLLYRAKILSFLSITTGYSRHHHRRLLRLLISVSLPDWYSLPWGSFTSRVFRSSFSSCNFIWWKPREKSGAKLLSSSLALRPSENIPGVRLSARKKTNIADRDFISISDLRSLLHFLAFSILILGGTS